MNEREGRSGIVSEKGIDRNRERGGCERGCVCVGRNGAWGIGRIGYHNESIP